MCRSGLPRGDLGVELELERVPFAQKLLIARAKKAQLRASGSESRLPHG